MLNNVKVFSRRTEIHSYSNLSVLIRRGELMVDFMLDSGIFRLRRLRKINCSCGREVGQAAVRRERTLSLRSASTHAAAVASITAIASVMRSFIFFLPRMKCRSKP